MEDENVENIPAGVDRRAFVKGALTAAGLGVAGAAGFGMFKQAAIVKPTTTRIVKYFGAKVLPGSPAPRGIPLIPITVNADGIIEGVPVRGEGDDEQNYLDWYRYCSHENAPGLIPENPFDNTLEYFLTKEKLEAAGGAAKERWWYHDRLETPVRADHWKDLPFNTGAAFRWRSAGQSGNNVITGILLKLDPKAFKRGEKGERENFMIPEHNLIAFSTFCTHFCCVPAFHEDPAAKTMGFWDMIFCTCHNSRYNPREITEYSFELTLEKGAGKGGAH